MLSKRQHQTTSRESGLMKNSTCSQLIIFSFCKTLFNFNKEISDNCYLLKYNIPLNFRTTFNDYKTHAI